MASTVFVSHAGTDAPRAAAIAGLLTASGLDVRYDRHELRLGDSFLAFMNSALTVSDYCLLLWSRQAAATPWVQLEWEAALYRSVKEKHSFLVVGRLEDIAPPALLGPRLQLDLFPDLQPGVAALLDTWRADRAAENEGGKPVGAAWTSDPESDAPASVYITSEQFAITVPIRVKLQEPAGMCVERCVAQLNLPRQFSHDSGIGVRFTYQLLHDDELLTQVQSLERQGVRTGAVLWLQTTMTTFSATAPVAGAHSSTVFRSGESDDAAAPSLLEEAEDELRRSITRAGLLQ